ncbi:hypothetical protein NHX12_019234 [Muraenolepis orangiensis]|uniref:Uncharacterized protein n=1 Tax=Muraenolepis orangiensis TaxID=630683 RepID=A0A9Q0EYF1_9TELE|nr:hypothetical protein NHX12_019234 [Muraenolepis orangiensis]
MKAKATSLEALRRRSNTSSIMILDQVVKEVCAALPESPRAFAEDADLCEQWMEDGDYSFPSLQVTPAVRDWHEGAGHLLTMRTPHPGTFQACGKKETYHLCVKVLNLRSLAGVKESRWAEFFGPDSSPERQLVVAVHKLPVEKQTADLQWRMLVCRCCRGCCQAEGGAHLLPQRTGHNVQAFSHMWAVWGGGGACALWGGW